MARSKSCSIDYVLLILISVLVVWGLFTVGTASFPLSLEKKGNTWYYFVHQILKFGAGVVLGLVAFKFPLKKLKKIAPFLFFLNLILLALVFFPKIGIKSGGAYRWLSIGGLSLQPSEFLKISFILYLAAWLSEKKITQDKKRTKKMLIPFSVILAVLMFGLIMQPDMSTLVIICFTGISMYLLASAPWWHILCLGGAGAAFMVLFINTASYRLNRFLSFLQPHSDPLGQGYQLKQSAIAIGSGKIFGVANGFSLGLSRQKFGFLPEAITDSIFAIIAEELGFVGGLTLILLFLIFAWRGLKLAVKNTNSFEGLLASGIVIWISLQALLNIGGIVGILPLTGIPLPFFSYGGSHIIAEMVGVGLLLNISKIKK